MTYSFKKHLALSEKEFVPHKMYDADGKEYDASTLELHLKYKKMGYTHKRA